MVNKSHCFEVLLDNKLPERLPEIVVMFGNDSFLRKETIQRVLGLAKLDEAGARRFDGDSCTWRDVHDELATLSLFESGACRIAIVKDGDDLVKVARPQLEKWFAAPAESSLLLLEVSSFAANTKLYKLASEKGWCIECSPPKGKGFDSTADSKAVEKWVSAWAEQQLSLRLNTRQTATFVDLVGTDFGLLHQELTKLALFAEDGQVSDEAIKKNVGGWRLQTVWKITDAVCDGNAGVALNELQKVFSAGEHPMAVVPQMCWSLRRFGVATHLIVQSERHSSPIALSQALSQSGFRSYELDKAQRQLKRIGRARASRLLDELLNLDLKIKGSHSQIDRAVFAIEQFVCWLA